MDRYAICENGRGGENGYQPNWVVWNTRYGWEVGRFVMLMDAITFVLAAQGALIDWTEWK